MKNGLLLAAHLAVLTPLSTRAMPGAVAPADAPPAARDGVSFALKAPLFDERFASVPVAIAGDEVITIAQFSEALATAHTEHGADAKAGKKDVKAIIERLVEARLLVAEAREMGILELKETKAAIRKFEEVTARELLKARVTRDVKPDPKEVERTYRAAVRESKLKSVLFPKEEDAKAFLAAVAAGKGFDALAAEAVADKKAKGGEEAQFAPVKRLLPAVAAAVAAMEAGKVSDPIRLANGFAVVRVDEVRYPDDEKARAEAEQRSLANEKGKALRAYYDKLVKRLVKVDEALLKTLDFEAKKPGFAALEKDKRVIARVKGGKNVTVADLAAGLKERAFHGVDVAAKEKRLNRQMLEVIDVLISERVVPLEAARLGIPKSTEYATRVDEFVDSMLFSKLVEKAIAPDVKVGDAEVQAYYEANAASYTYPAFYKLDGLAFGTVKAAQAALDKLASGTDFKWFKANAEGQLDPAKQTLRLDGSLVTEKSLTADLAKSIAGAKDGDYRLHAHGKEEAYVVRVVERLPESKQPLDEVKGEIHKKLYGERLNAAVRAHAAKLREALEVKIFVTAIEG